MFLKKIGSNASKLIKTFIINYFYINQFSAKKLHSGEYSLNKVVVFITKEVLISLKNTINYLYVLTVILLAYCLICRQMTEQVRNSIPRVVVRQKMNEIDNI